MSYSKIQYNIVEQSHSFIEFNRPALKFTYFEVLLCVFACMKNISMTFFTGILLRKNTELFTGEGVYKILAMMLE